MPFIEDASHLLESLRQRHGVDEPGRLLGPCVFVPNKDFKREWSQLLSQAGYRVYVGEREGKAAWSIPLKAKRCTPAYCEDPRSVGAEPSNPTSQATLNQAPRRGCITGRTWTQTEDEQILRMLNQGKSAVETAKELSVKLGRTERAVKDRVRKLKRRQKVESEPPQTNIQQVESPVESRVPAGSEQAKLELRSLLASALLLAESPKHKPALKLLLEACLKNISSKPGES